MPIQKSLKNAMLTGNGLVSWHNNEPTQYAGKQRQYFSTETRTFTQMYAKYASDFVEAQIQGIDPADPFAYQTRMIRMADIVKPTAAIQRDFDDYKMILVADRDIEYLMPGAKIIALGNTWLVFNPMNMSGSDGAAVIRRCNAVWNHLDEYGNILSEPIIVENERASANDSDGRQRLLITKGYFNVKCQYNEQTRQLNTNSRMILGTGAYRVTGFSDFEQEFTGDYSTVRMLNFSVRYEEPNLETDDMVNHVADGKCFTWNISISGAASMSAGATAQLTATSYRCGEKVDAIQVVGKTLYAPSAWSADNRQLTTGESDTSNGTQLVAANTFVSYTWTSSTESVLTVNDEGIVTAVSAGEATIMATLTQNPAYSASMAITVTDTQDGVFFTETVPESVNAYSSVTVAAAYYEDGEETQNAITWEVTGQDGVFSYTESEDGMSVDIVCYGYSPAPITVTATYDNGSETYSASADIYPQGI